MVYDDALYKLMFSLRLIVRLIAWKTLVSRWWCSLPSIWACFIDSGGDVIVVGLAFSVQLYLLVLFMDFAECFAVEPSMITLFWAICWYFDTGSLHRLTRADFPAGIDTTWVSVKCVVDCRSWFYIVFDKLVVIVVPICTCCTSASRIRPLLKVDCDRNWFVTRVWCPSVI